MQLSPEDIKLFSAYLDDSNLIAQSRASGADGGDSTHRFGLAYSALKLLGYTTWLDGVTPIDDYYYMAMRQYELTKDTYVRHPGFKWYSNPLNFSRDQTKMILDAMLVKGDKSRVRGLFKEIMKRFGFHKNEYPNYTSPGDPLYKKKFPDIVTPSEIGDYLRSFDSTLLYPLLCGIDLFQFIDIYLAKKDDDASKLKGKRTDYYVMLCVNISVSRSVQDTFILKLAAKQLAKSDYKSSIEWIFGPKWDDPPLHKLIIPLCERYIK